MKKNKEVEAIDSDFEAETGGVDPAVPGGPANFELLKSLSNF
jgi:hypothetical protein